MIIVIVNIWNTVFLALLVRLKLYNVHVRVDVPSTTILLLSISYYCKVN